MARTPQDVTDAELAVLQLLWDGGPATVRQLTDRLYPGGRASHFGTVHKLLERLEAKGCVARDKAADGALRFRAAVARDDLLGRWLDAVAEKLCQGSLTPLLTHLVRSRRLTDQDYQDLRQLIEDLDQKGTTRKGRKERS
jgi:predicted transcriptional regulator